MSDERLRELERRWRDTGAHDDEVALLRQRARSGDLPAERVAHAALCGHEASRHACDLGLDVPAPLSQPWLQRLRTEAGELHARIALALAREVLADLARLLPADERPARALHAAEWLATAPDDATAQHAVTSAVPLVVDAIEDRSRRSDFLRPARAAASDGSSTLAGSSTRSSKCARSRAARNPRGLLRGNFLRADAPTPAAGPVGSARWTRNP